MENRLKLTIFTPTYNRGKFLYRLFDSIMKQNSKDIEWLIVDDGSVDKTNIICSDFCSHYENFRLFTSNHDGVSKARNVGLHKARGQYVMFLDGDDYIDLNSLSYISKLILSTKKTRAMYVKAPNFPLLFYLFFPPPRQMVHHT